MNSVRNLKEDTQLTALALIILMLFASLATSASNVEQSTLIEDFNDANVGAGAMSLTGNEAITIDPSTWHIDQGDTFYANISATGLSTTVSYQIEWDLCNEWCYFGPYDNGSLSIPSGVTSFLTMITINATGYSGNGTIDQTHLRVHLNSSGYLVDVESNRFAVGDNTGTTIWTYGGNNGNFLLGTDHPSLRVRTSPVNHYVTYGTNYTMDVKVEDSSGTSVYSNTSSIEANSSYQLNQWYPENYVNLSSVASPALQAGVYTIYANLTNNNLSHTKQYQYSFTMVDLGLSGNEAITIDPSTWHIDQGDTFYADISATGLSTTAPIKLNGISVTNGAILDLMIAAR